MLPKYNDIVELIKKGSTIEAQEKVLELREAALEIQEENLELRSKVKVLEEQISLKETVQWEKPHYWIINGDERDGPYCQKCYDADQKLIRMQGEANDEWRCLECKSNVLDPRFQRPQVRVPRAQRF